jgi:alpha/beta superfamily hydrolase
MIDNTELNSFSGGFEAFIRISRLLIITLAMVFPMNNLKAESSIEIAPGLMGVVHEPAVAAIGLVVIAPGAGYDMSQPLITDAAEEAASLGYRVLRFNWRYVTANSERADGIENEVRDLKEAVQYLKTITHGDEQITLIGKSLGSIVAARVAAEDSYPAILLTPICRSETQFKNFYKPTNNGQVMIAGDNDPLCDTQILFSYVDPSTKVSILQGDHGFEGASLAESKRNRAAVRKLVGYWLDSWAG